MFLFVLINFSGVVGSSDVGSYVVVSDQYLVDGSLVVDEVGYNSSGWIVVHSDLDGEPGDIIGVESISAGVNRQVVVKVDRSKVTDVLYPMLHTDRSILGKYEINYDFPVYNNGRVIAPGFRVLNFLSSGIYGGMGSVGDGVIIAHVVSEGPGWVIVRSGGEDLGISAVSHGENVNVTVSLSREVMDGEVVKVLLYLDRGIVGEFESVSDHFSGHEKEFEVVGGEFRSVEVSASFPVFGLMLVLIVVLFGRRRFRIGL